MSQAKKRFFWDKIERSPTTLKAITKEFQHSQLISDAHHAMITTKQQQPIQKDRLKRSPRFSQVDPLSNQINFRSPLMLNQNTKISKTKLLSPKNYEKGFKKSDCSALRCNKEIASSTSINSANISMKQLQNFDKQKVKDRKQYLNQIEDMVNNYLVKVQKPKPQKSPRYSEPVFFGKGKQFIFEDNETGENKYNNVQIVTQNEFSKQITENPKELKQTISTVSSMTPITLQDENARITDFQFIKDLGKGKYGSVKLAVHKKTGLLFSIKIMKKAMVQQENILEQLINQIKFQSFINHSNIVKLYNIIQDRLYVYLIMEACVEGNLYNYIRKVGAIQEKQASKILKSVGEALAELHSYQIIHRDLKPENIVMCYGMPKICDFGWSAIKDSLRETFCGTPLYVSPELLRGCPYDQKIDVWALGIIGFEMINGKIPFNIRSQLDLFRIVQGQIKYPDSMNTESISCLSLMLQKDPQKRANIQKILDHPFLH